TGAKGTTLLERVSHAEVEDLAKLAPDVPELSAIANKAMAFDPGNRYPTAGAFAEDLRRYLNGLLVEAHQYSASEVIRRWIHRHRAVTFVGVLSLLSLGAVGAVAIDNITAERDRAEVALEALTESELRAKGSEADARKHAARASHEAKEAQEKSLLLLKEDGRRKLDEGRPIEALVPLLEAYEQAPDDRVTRFMVADAMRPVDALRYSLPPDPEGIVRLRTSKTKPRFLTVNGEMVNRLWNADSGETVATLATGYASDFFNNSEKIVVIDKESVVHTYDTETGSLQNSWNLNPVPEERHDQPARHLLPNAKLLLELDRDSAQLFDIDTGEPVAKHNLSSSRHPWARSFVVAEGGETWMIKDDRELIVGDGTGRVTRHRLPKSRRLAAVGPSREQVILEDSHWIKGMNRHSIYNIKGESTRLENCGGFDDEMSRSSFKFTGDGALLIGRDSDGGLAIWNSSNGRCHGNGYGDAAIDIKVRAGEVVTGGSDGTLALWSYTPSLSTLLQSNIERQTVPQSYISKSPGAMSRHVGFRAHAVAIADVGWLSDGAVVTASAAGMVSVWDLQRKYNHRYETGWRSSFWPNSNGSVIVQYSPAPSEQLQFLSLPDL
ncbi:MAG: hypothetical protein ACPG4T_21950, partial [Nannocystaceae bacterium]